MQNPIRIEPVSHVPLIQAGDDLAAILITSLRASGLELIDGDILCVASKVVSITEHRFVDLTHVRPTADAEKLHQAIPRKDPRVVQLILDEANGDAANIRVTGNWIGARTKLGRWLTSGGIDKVDDRTVLRLPTNPDASARQLGRRVAEAFSARIGVLITDSDGREGIAGATQLCIGLYGIPPLRKQNDTEETVCDMIAAAAGLAMGQRGNHVPAVIVRGFAYTFEENAQLSDAY